MAFLDDISTLLTSSTVAGGATGWPLYLGHLPDSSAIGDKAVALLETAGQEDMGRVDLERPGLQVVVRGAPTNTTSTAYQETQARAKLINGAIHAFTGTPSSGAYIAGLWNQSGPFFSGFDETWRPYFSANYLVWRQST